MRRQDIDWNQIISSVYEYENMELWFYNCEWGKDKNNQHIQTFGSLVRNSAGLAVGWRD